MKMLIKHHFHFMTMLCWLTCTTGNWSLTQNTLFRVGWFTCIASKKLTKFCSFVRGACETRNEVDPFRLLFCFYYTFIFCSWQFETQLLTLLEMLALLFKVLQSWSSLRFGHYVLLTKEIRRTKSVPFYCLSPIMDGLTKGERRTRDRKLWILILVVQFWLGIFTLGNFFLQCLTSSFQNFLPGNDLGTIHNPFHERANDNWQRDKQNFFFIRINDF